MPVTFLPRICCCWASQSCPTLCDAMDCNPPGFPVHHHLPEFAQTHVHCKGDLPKGSWLLKWQNWNHISCNNLPPRQAVFLFNLTDFLKQLINHLHERSEKGQLESLLKIPRLTACFFWLPTDKYDLNSGQQSQVKKLQLILFSCWEMRISLAMKQN